MSPRRGGARGDAPLLLVASTVALVVLVYVAGGFWAGNNSSRDWARSLVSILVPDAPVPPVPLEAAWCASALGTHGNVACCTGRLRSRGRHWRAAFYYCTNPPPCVLEGITDAVASTVSVRAAHRSEKRPLRGSVFAGEAFEILIHARDASGNDRECGGDSFLVEITGPSLFHGHAVDALDGTHVLEAVLYDVGRYEVRARLDYRACVGLTRCDMSQTKTMVLEYVGEAPLVLDVVAASPPLEGRPCLSAVGASVPCGVEYGVNRSFDDPMYRRGRWQSDALACAAVDASALPVNGSAPTPLSMDELRLRERCGDPFLRSQGWLWRALQKNERPVFPLDALRGKWLHSIGDSLSRNLNNDISKILGRTATSERFCIYALSAELHLGPQKEATFTCPEAADAPFMVRDNCSAPPPTAWTDADSGRRFRAPYHLLWMHEYFPSLDFRLTFQWMTVGTGIFNGHEASVTFKSWSFEPYIRFVDRYKPARTVSAEQAAAASSEVPDDGTLTETVTVAASTETAEATRTTGTDARHILSDSAATLTMVATVGPTPSTTSILAMGSHASARLTETVGQPAYPPLRIVDRAMLDQLFPSNTTPSFVLVNAGLHHVPSLKFDVLYDRYVYGLLARVRADFPPPASRVLWRSTAQTQWWSKTLPHAHMCRTSYRLSYLNERAANAIAHFNEAEAAAGRPPIRVVDYLQVSLGRPDAVPDNRHYHMNVSGTVVDELLNVLKDCT